ncbi:hypothetical protein F4777DRAFT_114293 [Nemania sp. FL0916]|nr:hypothetical protein F4777DRAFT_114293 [Nemania sp. FL0916]
MHFLLCLSAAASTSASAFSITAFVPSNSLDGAVIHASDSGFHSGLTKPTTYCSLHPASKCPKVAGTLVSENMEHMAVSVPGGQQIYVQPDGQVQYTIPHSADRPPGSIVGCWHRKTSTFSYNIPQAHDVLDFDDSRGHKGLALCPHTNSTKGGTHMLYARTKDFNVKSCVDVVGLTLTKSDANVGCWEYT